MRPSFRRGGIGGEGNTLYDKTNESRLWRHVLLRAIADAAYGADRRRLEIGTWVADPEDFDTVCHYAGVDTDYMSRQFADILTAPKAVRRVLAGNLRRALSEKDGDDIV